ncbi:uncharacterized protein B0P05DRAFT_495393 [Gilbertella persicaria]|uniref:uncharacterized protein n=1 Tax=Gilbertella persicaria TaxID=101096 RepID=UPI00221EDF59|nr:uncharacterized protein B0P05DRAFT_495393 [Gilbertella persicaria]KAI8068124.1 hypothetical protein B0P05DRAFT_495393 [Gilbertella persicaria]
MNYLLLVFSLLVSIFIAKANQVVIECKFPCTNSDEICEVSSNFVKCTQKTNSTKWILKNAMSLPEYQGTAVQIGQTCTPAPLPYLKDASHLATNASETIINWPSRDYDAYFSNCDADLYCDRANVCVKKLQQGSVCESDNQCLHGICSQSTCQASPSSNGSSHIVFNTIHIVVTVIGILLFFGVMFAVYMFGRRRRLQKEKKLAEKKFESGGDQPSRSNSSSSNATRIAHTRASSTTTLHSHPNNAVTNMLHPDYESHFMTTEAPIASLSPSMPNPYNHNHTPSMQQQQLQYQLQRQLLIDKKKARCSNHHHLIPHNFL